MTDLTTRELMDTILRSLAETRAAFKKIVQPSTDDRTTLQPDQKEVRPNETVDAGKP
jgi:hypothetical protein